MLILEIGLLAQFSLATDVGVAQQQKDTHWGYAGYYKTASK